MGALTDYVIEGFSCDGRGCPAVVRGPAMPYATGIDRYKAEADALGWTFWASRTLRAYCPDHGPSKGSGLRRVPATKAQRRATVARALREASPDGT